MKTKFSAEGIVVIFMGIPLAWLAFCQMFASKTGVFWNFSSIAISVGLGLIAIGFILWELKKSSDLPAITLLGLIILLIGFLKPLI